MVPGELHVAVGKIKLNIGRPVFRINVINCGDRPVQIGSHFHFYEVNKALKFDRIITIGFRLNIPSGTAIRFEPGQTRNVELVQYSGERKIFGFNKEVMGKIDV